MRLLLAFLLCGCGNAAEVKPLTGTFDVVLTQSTLISGPPTLQPERQVWVIKQGGPGYVLYLVDESRTQADDLVSSVDGSRFDSFGRNGGLCSLMIEVELFYTDDGFRGTESYDSSPQCSSGYYELWQVVGKRAMFEFSGFGV